MALIRKNCLICDDLAVIEVMSLALQCAPLCGKHWADYCMGPDSTTAQEIGKYFADGLISDLAEPINETVERYGVHYKTDETCGRYDPTKKR
jgi:hypothetical protein